MTIDRTVANAQIILSIVFLAGYFTMLGAILAGYIRTPEAWKDVLTALISVLTAGVLTIVNYWFSRQRSASHSGEPGPGAG